MAERKPVTKLRDRGCDIALLVDAETGRRAKSGRFALDRASVEAHVDACLRALRHRVAVVPFSIDIVDTIRELRSLKPALVFNLTEWVDGDRSLDAAIAGLLEMMKLPFTGTGPDGLRLARDKVLAKQIVATLGVAVPGYFVIDGGDPVRDPEVPYPLIVKPRFGDGSDAISNRSIVNGRDELGARVASLRARTAGAVLCEEYIDGRDLFVALLGNEPQVLPPLELTVGVKAVGSPRIATRHLKHDARYRARWRVRYRETPLSDAVILKIDEASRAIFHALKLRDYARIDYRLTPDGRLVFIEANPNPDLSPHTFGRNRCFAGVPYSDLIRRIVEAARSRMRDEAARHA